MGFIAELERRGLLNQKTAQLTDRALETSDTPLYVGFDPSADSLHAGSLIPLLSMDRYRTKGKQIIVLCGGATGLIGDPSGKDEERALQKEEVVRERIRRLERQMRHFFRRTDGPRPIFVNNLDWYRGRDVLWFLRDIGKHFSVNQMLTRDSVRSRLDDREQGISYTEFSYALLQSYDYLHLYETFGCKLQMGASDQWGNIVSGTDLIRRRHAETVHGLTLPLLTNAAGKKYGKSEKGAVWLDPTMTSPFHFYQFWLNSADHDVERFLLWLTDFPVEQIRGWMKESAPERRTPQRELARWLTARTHGKQAAALAERASAALFSGFTGGLSRRAIDMLAEAVPTAVMPWHEKVSLAETLMKVGAVQSKKEAGRLIQQGGISANGAVIGDLSVDLRRHSHEGAPLVLSRGKSSKFLVLFD